jgi:hypothetical protein
VTTQSNGQVRRLVLPDLAPPDSNAQACPRPRAREDEATPAVTLGELPARAVPVTARIAALFAGGSLLHARPASLAEAHERHLHAAGAFSVRSLRWPRLVWAYLIHLPVKTAAHVLDWVTESPARALVAALLLAAAWIWH